MTLTKFEQHLVEPGLFRNRILINVIIRVLTPYTLKDHKKVDNLNVFVPPSLSYSTVNNSLLMFIKTV